MTVTDRLRDLVVQNPEDASARGVYADALIQAGDPRGTFIMLQAHLEGSMSPDKREEAKRESAALLAANKAAWTKLASGWAEVRFKGGFIHAIRAKASAFVNSGTALLAAEPVVDLTLTEANDGELIALAAMPALAKVKAIALQGPFKDKGAAAFVKSPHLGSLRALNIAGASVGPGFANAVGYLGGLVSLCLTGMAMGDVAVAVLAEGLENLERLYLARNDLTDTAAESLANGKSTKLKVLCLGGNEISDEGAEALATGRSLASLEHLELNQTGVADEGAQAIVKSRVLKSLRKLDLRTTDVEDAPSRKDLTVLC